MLPPGTTLCPRDGARAVADNPFVEEATVRRDPGSPPVHGKAAGVAQPLLTPAPVELSEEVREGSWEATVSRDMLVGKQLGDFIVKRRIGAGGMGIVYEGEHPIIGRKVAIKILRPEFSDGGGARDLISEARAASAIRHRGIIDVFGFGTIPHIGQYLVMEYLEGAPLDEIIAQRAPMLEAEVIALLDELLGALGAAHAMGVIHRDLKPGNIFVVRDSGGGESVKVLDFGLAKRSEMPNGTSPQTRASMIVGTPEYMAPEQASGQAVGPHTDLYSVGVIAFEMLTRRIPFEGPSAMSIAIQHVQAKPPPPSTYVDLHPALDELVVRMLAKTAAQRPASAEAVRRELKAISRQLADGATRLEPAPRGEKPTDQIPSVRTERPPAPAGRAAPGHSRPEVDSVTVTRTASTNPEESISQSRLAPITTEEGAVPARFAPTTERVAAVRPSRLPQVAVGGLLLLALGGAGFWALQRKDPSIPVQPTVIETPSSPSPGGTEPVTVLPPPREVKTPNPAVDVKPPDPATLDPSVAVKPPPDETVKPPPNGTTAEAIAQQGGNTTQNPKKKPGEQTQGKPVPPPKAKGKLLLIVRGGWANIYVDEKEMGRVPPTHELVLPAGRHKLELINPGLKPYRGSVTVTAGQTTEHEVILQNN
ncbi:serine/threonine-protein kinase [Hyalangium sp.]|uniref:serine/threonine-protein kinase n=1 Tax=Hyalangium sp. TaxID=2028555 RepID=UPI002D4ECC76|nr:protein kinase [Hyalangium sp.]HYH97493.1 protein kinase [Hyalangium sp.]